MSKTIKVSDETYEKIKDQIEEEKVKEAVEENSADLYLIKYNNNMKTQLKIMYLIAIFYCIFLMIVILKPELFIN